MGDHIPHYPVFLTLESRLVIVVGGDAAAQRKVTQMARYGADIVVITPDPSAELRQLETEGAITVEPRGYIRGDLQGAFLVYCTETDEIARAVFAEAESLGCLVNVADVPAYSNYRVPSSIRRGQLQIAISTSGAAPAVAKRLRHALRERFGPEWTVYIALLGDVRALATRQIAEASRLSAVIAASAELGFLERIAASEEITAEVALAESEAAVDAAAKTAAAEAAAEIAAAAAMATAEVADAAAVETESTDEQASEPATEE